jgi:rubrerythrin
LAEPRSEHHDLRALLTELADAEGERHSVLLAQLREELPQHFAREEAPQGWFDQAIEAAPQHADEIGRLKVQHRALLMGVREATTPADTRAVVQALLAHERAEAAILTDIWYEETGVAD